MALWSRFFGSAGSQAVGVAMGAAAVPALVPFSQDLINEAWSLHQSHPLLAATLAQGVAQGQVDRAWATTEAGLTGISKERFDHLVDIANVGPGIAEAFNLWRRGIVTDDGFKRALKRLGLEQEWIDDLVKAKDVLLTPSELANARQQGFIADTRQHTEAAAQGVTSERADIQFELAGLPPGIETALAMLRRSIITQDTFKQIVREGHTKVKYTDDLLALQNQVLSAANYAELWLRGWITEKVAKDGGALTGYDAAAMDLLYLNRGRPATTRQAFIGYTRGGRVAGEKWDERETHKRAVSQSNIRTEWEPVLWAQRYTYPSAFVLRNLTQSGDITQATAEQVLLYEGWEPSFAKQVSTAWATPSANGSDPHVTKAQTQLWTTLHNSYKNGESDAVAAQDKLTTLGISAADQTTILHLWDEERELIRKQLTPSQIKKAYTKAVPNPDTGAPWTRDDALAALIDRGYSAADASTFLAE